MSADPSVTGTPVGSPVTGPEGVDVFELGTDHEQVVFCNDQATGLRAIVAIHSTALGPALGGTRFYPYATTADALRDVLNLSRGMSYKAALAGLDLGGGKAVIIGDPMTDKTEALLRAYGRFVQSLGGRYYTACDVGTYSEDMDVVARECRFVTGRTVAHGGAGDSSVLTAYGVFQGMRASAEAALGLAEPVAAAPSASPASARSGTTWSSTSSRTAPRGRHRRLPAGGRHAWSRSTAPRRSPTPTRWSRAELDVYAPCAMGDALTDDVVDVLTAKIVCGAANNQLAHPGIEKALADRGILYAPDYCVNSGGLIQVADELEGFSFERAEQRASRIYDTTKAVFELAAHRRGHPGRGRRPARRAPDARRRPAARALPAGLTRPASLRRTRATRSAHPTGGRVRRVVRQSRDGSA